ncbi:MAG TPA: hypothetical protein VKA27_02605, partial [Sunxiuqinia sp.]|nr:hypothetical protein [Sunxiuqinia sp.]
MLKSIHHFITKPYRFDSGEDKRKILGLHVVLTAGLLFSLVDFSLSLAGHLKNECIPGDVALIAITVVALYCLRIGRPHCSINMIFAVPIPIYFFFISAQYSLFPVQNAISYTIWTLIPGFLFLLLFSQKIQKNLIIYFVVSLATTGYHIFKADRLGDILTLYWPTKEMIVNPLIILTVVFVATLLVAISYELNLKELRNLVIQTDQQISKTIRSFHQGVLLMQVIRDEMDNPIGLKILKSNSAFQKLFKVNARELHNNEADVIFPKIFRDSFDWNNYYFHSKLKQRTEIHLEHLNLWVEVYSLQPSQDQIASIF